MCAVFAVIVAIVVAAALYVPRANVARVRSAGRGSPCTRRVAVDVELGGPEAPHVVVVVLQSLHVSPEAA